MRSAQVAIVGGGPAGLAAAIAAARTGARTVLLEEQPEVGGQLRYRVLPLPADSSSKAPSATPPGLAASLRAEATAAGVDLRPGSLAWGLFARNILGVVDDNSSYQLAAEVVVLATGSTDLPFAFAGGTLPGVFSARAIQILLNRHRVLPGRRFAVLGGGPEAAEVAEDIRLAGGDVMAAVDPAANGLAVEAHGRDGIEAITLGGRRHQVEVVVVAVGRQPDTALALMAGCSFGFSLHLGGHVPILDGGLGTSNRQILVAGDAAGTCDLATALAEGRHAGISATAVLGLVDDATLAEAQTAYERSCPERVAARHDLAPSYVQTYA